MLKMMQRACLWNAQGEMICEQPKKMKQSYEFFEQLCPKQDRDIEKEQGLILPYNGGAAQNCQDACDSYKSSNGIVCDEMFGILDKTNGVCNCNGFFKSRQACPDLESKQPGLQLPYFGASNCAEACSIYTTDNDIQCKQMVGRHTKTSGVCDCNGYLNN